jgi:hypothetical protein
LALHRPGEDLWMNWHESDGDQTPIHGDVGHRAVDDEYRRRIGAQGEKFFTIRYAQTCEPIRRLQKKNAVVYDVENL